MKRVRSFLPTGVEVSLPKHQCSRRIALCFATLERLARERESARARARARARERQRARASERERERESERERKREKERERERQRHCLTCFVFVMLLAEVSDTESESDDELTPSQDRFLKRQRQPAHVGGPAREDGKARASNGGKGLGRASKAGKESSRKPQSFIHNTGLSHLFWVIVL